MRAVFAALLAIVATTCLAAVPAAAATYELGSPAIAQVTLPDAWSPTVTERGVEATSADDEIYVAVRPAAIENAEDAVKQTLAYLVGQGVKIDVSTQRQQAAQINGMDAVSLAYSGKDEDDENIEISVSVFIISPSAAVILTYWGSKEGEQTYASELRGILQSLVRK